MFKLRASRVNKSLTPGVSHVRIGIERMLMARNTQYTVLGPNSDVVAGPFGSVLTALRQLPAGGSIHVGWDTVRGRAGIHVVSKGRPVVRIVDRGLIRSE